MYHVRSLRICTREDRRPFSSKNDSDLRFHIRILAARVVLGSIATCMESPNLLNILGTMLRNSFNNIISPRLYCSIIIPSLFLTLLQLVHHDTVSAFGWHSQITRQRTSHGGTSISLKNSYLNNLSIKVNISNPVDTEASSDEAFPIIEPPTFETLIADDKTKKKSRTQRIMEAASAKTNPSGQTLGAGGSSTYEAFLKAEERWKKLKLSQPIKNSDPYSLLKGNEQTSSLLSFVTDDGAKGNARCWEKLRNSATATLDFDVVVCGGTLGIFIALALQLKGYKVCVVEAGRLRGREQEWNISRKELEELIREGILSEEEVERAITTEFPGCRAGFKNEEGTVATPQLHYGTLNMLLMKRSFLH